MTALVPVDVGNYEESTGKRLGGVTGKGFMPGHAPSGGRPKGVDAFRKRILRETKDCAEVVTYLVETMRHSRSARERIDAATLLLAYAYGKPVQPTDVTADLGGAVTVRVVYEGAQIDDEDGDGRD